MIFYILKIAIIIAILFMIIISSLQIIMEKISQKDLTKVSIILTGVITIFYIVLSSSIDIEGFEVPNAEDVAQEEEITENVEQDLERVLNTLNNKEESIDQEIEDGPKPATNSSIVTTTGISDQQGDIEVSEEIGEIQPVVEETTEAIPSPNETLEPRPEPQIEIKQPLLNDDEKEVEKKYNILPVEQWLKPDAVDIIKATPCQCQDIASYRDGYAPY